MNQGLSFTLANAPLGRPVRIREIKSHSNVSVRLRELGFCENAVIRCLNRGNGNVICEVCNNRLGINNLLASTISVFTL